MTIPPVRVEAVVSEFWNGRYAAICMGQRNGIIASESGPMALSGPDRSPLLVMEGGKRKLTRGEGNWLSRYDTSIK